MFRIISLLLIAVFINASTFKFSTGNINAQTDVTFKGLIDIKTSDISSKLTMEKNIETLKGTVSLKSYSLKSGDEDRDVNMYELLQSKLHPYISFRLNSIEKKDEKYLLKGVLSLNGINRVIKSLASIEKLDNKLNLEGTFSIKLTEFNMEPPSIVILNVRDRIDIKYKLNYKEK